MKTSKVKIDFNNSEAGIEVKALLESMMLDKAYKTDQTYTANSDLYPDNLMPFIDKHMNFLRTHSSVDPHMYMSNLRLMTRLRLSPSIG